MDVDYACQSAKNGQNWSSPHHHLFLWKIPVKRTVARLSFRSGTIVRVRLKFVLNYHWNQYLYYANFASAIDSYGNFMVTLTMVPDRFESRATAHLIAFKQSEMMMVGGKPVLANLSTLTCVAKVFIIHYFTTAPASGIHAYTRQGLNCSTY